MTKVYERVPADSLPADPQPCLNYIAKILDSPSREEELMRINERTKKKGSSLDKISDSEGNEDIKD